MYNCRIFLVGFLSWVYSVASSSMASNNVESRYEFPVFGYLPEYRLNNFDYESVFSAGLTHLIYFSLEIDPKTHRPSALDRLPSDRDLRKARIAADKRNGKLLLGLGGNARSEGFASMVLKKSRRNLFLKDLNSLLVENRLDGVDYNWEYPASSKEWRNWGKLMEESKKVLLNGNNIVTFTMYLDPNHYKVIETHNLLQHADFVHCMAYDQRGEHSTVPFAQSGINYAKSSSAFNFSKWTLGVPFYGRNIRNGEPAAYYDIQSKTSFSQSTDVLNGIYFNSQETLSKKIKLAYDAKVGGVMIWELGQDKQPFTHPDSLLFAMNATLTRIKAAATLARGARPPPDESNVGASGGYRIESNINTEL